MTDLARALADPAGIYQEPADVLKDVSLSHEEKIQVLKQWEYDARGILVADEENMGGDAASMLSRVHHALRELEER